MTTPDLKKLERYHGHDRGVVITQDAHGIFSERPMTRAELAAREPAAAIQDDIFKHANTAGVCYYPIWHLIAATIDTETATLQQEVETLRGQIARAYRQHPQPRHGTGEQMTRPDHCPTCGAFPVDIPAPPTDALVEALRLILPMAKGYAAAHPVGSNAEYIRIAEEALPKDGQTPQSGKKEEELIKYEVRSFRGPAHSGYYEVAVSTRDRAHAEQVFAQECERSLYVKLIEVSTRRRVLLVAPSPPASKAEGDAYRCKDGGLCGVGGFCKECPYCRLTPTTVNGGTVK